MNKELIIHTHPNGVDIALLQDKMLVEIIHEHTDSNFNVGDIFLGKIKKILPGLNAAFIDIGYEKDAFIHYSDLSPQIRSLMKFTGQAIAGHSDGTLNNAAILPEIEKTGNIKDVLESKNFILVQIDKEAISTKGPRLTCEITLPGRYVVLSPFTNSIGVSRKIDSADERKRLKTQIEQFKPKNFGVIVRTVAAGVSAKAIQEDLLQLQERWAEICKNLRGAQPVKKVLSEVDKTSGFLRDMLNSSFNSVVTDSPALAKELEEYLIQIAPHKKDILQKYSGKTPLFDHYGITKQIKSSFGRQVNLASGGYLIIEKTEACHVIDVNSGNRISNEANQETNALKVNMEAAEEVARQLRLRDMGGIIVIDFVDMKEAENRKTLLEKMKENMEGDRAIHTILPLSKFNLMEITRERVRPEVEINTMEECPTCGGSGVITSSLLLIDQIKEELSYLIKIHQRIKIYVHPFIAAYIKKGMPSLRMRWIWEYKKWIEVHSNENFTFADYKFFDENDEEIIIS